MSSSFVATTVMASTIVGWIPAEFIETPFWERHGCLVSRLMMSEAGRRSRALRGKTIAWRHDPNAQVPAASDFLADSHDRAMSHRQNQGLVATIFDQTAQSRLALRGARG